MIEAGPDPALSKDALLYDYSKHLLSLALLGIGGIASLAQSPQGRLIPGPQIALLIALFAFAGLCALSVTASLLRARRLDQPTLRIAWIGSQAAMLFLGIGVGVFLSVWIRALL